MSGEIAFAIASARDSPTAVLHLPSLRKFARHALPTLVESSIGPAVLFYVVLSLAGFRGGEVDRYLGWPAQAISYKVGERVWLAVRETLRRSEGAAFDLRRFHQRAFELGLVGLGQLERELAA